VVAHREAVHNRQSKALLCSNITSDYKHAPSSSPIILNAALAKGIAGMMAYAHLVASDDFLELGLICQHLGTGCSCSSQR
jgi:hypothetical protein